MIVKSLGRLHNTLHKRSEIPVPPGSVKFSHSARMSDLNVVVCDSDFDIINLHLNGFELDFLFRANERFVFRSYLASINVEHLSQVTIYSKVVVSYLRAPYITPGSVYRFYTLTRTGCLR